MRVDYSGIYQSAFERLAKGKELLTPEPFQGLEGKMVKSDFWRIECYVYPKSTFGAVLQYDDAIVHLAFAADEWNARVHYKIAEAYSRSHLDTMMQRRHYLDRLMLRKVMGGVGTGKHTPFPSKHNLVIPWDKFKKSFTSDDISSYIKSHMDAHLKRD